MQFQHWGGESAIQRSEADLKYALACHIIKKDMPILDKNRISFHKVPSRIYSFSENAYTEPSFDCVSDEDAVNKGKMLAFKGSYKVSSGAVIDAVYVFDFSGIKDSKTSSLSA